MPRGKKELAEQITPELREVEVAVTCSSEIVRCREGMPSWSASPTTISVRVTNAISG
ncbi:MAG: hypothetical protein ACKO6B_07390 [Planctomycetia bacterium]